MSIEPTTGNIAKALRVCFKKTCACSECPFEHESCGDLEQLAADRLERQEQTIAALTARAEQAERELAAAKADLHHNDACSVCIGAEQGICKDCDLECLDCRLDCRCEDCRDENKWEWRGAREGEGKCHT